MLAQRGELEVAQVVAVEPDRARRRGRRSEPAASRASTCRRRWGRPGRAVSPGSTRRSMPSSAARLGARIGERDPSSSISPRARASGRAPARSVTRGSLVEQLDHPLGAGQRLEERVRERAEAADRRVELGQVGDEDEHPAEGQRPFGDRHGPEGEHDQDPGQLDQVDEGREQPADPRRGELGLDHALVLAPEALADRAPGSWSPGSGRRWRSSPRRAAERADAPALLARGALDQAREVLATNQNAGRDDERDQRELPVEDEQRGAEEDDAEERREAVGDPGQQQAPRSAGRRR